MNAIFNLLFADWPDCPIENRGNTNALPASSDEVFKNWRRLEAMGEMGTFFIRTRNGLAD